MVETYGFTHAIVSKSIDADDPFAFHIHALRSGSDGEPDGDKVLIATVDDEKPMLATRILRIMRDAGMEIEGLPLEINMDEPDIDFLTLRGAIDDKEVNWTDLEVRFVDGEKTAPASFPEQYESFAYAMLELFGPKEPAYKRFALFSHHQHEAKGGWNDFEKSYDTLDEAKDSWRWKRASHLYDTEVEIVDLSTMTSVERRTIPRN